MVRQIRRGIDIILLVALVAIISISQWAKNNDEAKQIESAIQQLYSYRYLLQDIFQQEGQMPSFNQVFALKDPIVRRAGCNIPGICPVYYERLQNDPSKAFMSINIQGIKQPNRLFAAFVSRDSQVDLVCGPWVANDPQYLQSNRLPKVCQTPVKEFLGL